MQEIQDLCRALRLSGMADSFDARNKESLANQLSFAETFRLLLDDEKLHREQQQYERRYKKASFRGIKTLDNFDFKINPKIDQRLIRDLSTCRYIKEASPVIIEGPCGIGKTHIAQALGHCALKAGFEVLFMTQSKLIDELNAARATNSYATKIKRFTKVDLLIIDEFGLKPMKDNEDEFIHEIIAERYEIKSTIITSNLSIDEYHQAFTNKLLAVATVDRIRHDAYKVILSGRSYRSLKNNQKN